MRYHDGAVIHQENDLSSFGFGIPWGHTRVYGNTLSQSAGGQNGNSWLVVTTLGVAYAYENGSDNTIRPTLVTYDASGNWLSYEHLEGGSTVNQTRTHSKVNEIATYNANATPREYDKAGNMTRIPEGVTTTSIYRVATWDAWNRLRRVRKTSGTGSTSGTNFDVWYDYDGLTRRTQKRIVGGPNQGTTSYYYNRSWKCLEERKSGVSGPSRQYVFGIRGRNDLILRDRDTNNSGIVLEERLYALTDAMGSVTAITDKAGAVKERYRYTAFGVSQVMTPAFANRSISSYDWQTRFHGEQRDAETGYYNYGHRFYLPELGRWPSRDPIGERGGMNLYGMVANNGVNKSDILGEAPSRADIMSGKRCCVNDDSNAAPYAAWGNPWALIGEMWDEGWTGCDFFRWFYAAIFCQRSSQWPFDWTTFSCAIVSAFSLSHHAPGFLRRF